MILVALSAWAQEAGPIAGYDGGSALRGLVSVIVVLGLLLGLAWLVRRGAFGKIGLRPQGLVRIESQTPLGDRRSLMVVAVEGRRLLLGVTPAGIALVAELARAEQGFDGALARAESNVPGGAA
jgi:flagellar protein FliO/FliZ